MKKLLALYILTLLCVPGAHAAATKTSAKPAKAAEKSEAADSAGASEDSDVGSKSTTSKGAKSGKAGAFGLGADLNASLVARYWMSNKVALDMALGLGEMNFTTRFFWVPELRGGLAFTVATIPVGIGSLPFYLGGGVAFQPFVSSAFGWNLGVYGAVGFNFIPAKAPIDVFAELRPTLGIADSVWFGGFPLGFGSTAVGLRVVPTAGLRYYF